MRECFRMTTMRGFTCAVGRGDNLNPESRAAGIAVGIDDSGDERTLVIAARHADGTVLTIALGELLADRLEDLIADVRSAPAPIPARSMVIYQ